jgi:hypothetical protein
MDPPLCTLGLGGHCPCRVNKYTVAMQKPFPVPPRIPESTRGKRPGVHTAALNAATKAHGRCRGGPSFYELGRQLGECTQCEAPPPPPRGGKNKRNWTEMYLMSTSTPTCFSVFFTVADAGHSVRLLSSLSCPIHASGFSPDVHSFCPMYFVSPYVFVCPTACLIEKAHNLRGRPALHLLNAKPRRHCLMKLILCQNKSCGAAPCPDDCDVDERERKIYARDL